MRQDLTDITLVVDRSGSMTNMLADAEGGINEFITEQKAAEGEANLSLIQFDSEYEFIHKGTPIKDVPPYKLHPRGSTALIDAVGKAINETGERLNATAEADRPGLVIFVIVTDGGENSSREFTNVMVKEAVERQTNDYKWKFIYIGANQDAFAQAGGLGVGRRYAANYSARKAREGYQLTSSKVRLMRGLARAGATDAELNTQMEFTDSERQSVS